MFGKCICLVATTRKLTLFQKCLLHVSFIYKCPVKFALNNDVMKNNVIN
jgi:hypothetical protein